MITQIIINTIITGSIYALVAIGFNLTYCTTRFFNLAHGTFLAIGGYIFLWLTQTHSLNPILSVIIAVIFAGFMGWLSEKAIYKKLRDNKSTPMVLMVASIGLMTIIQSVIAICFGSQFRMLGIDYNFSVYKVFGAAITIPEILIIATLIITTIVLAVILKYTKFGKQVRAVGDDVVLAKAVGIDSGKIISIIFFLSSAIAALTGILIGLNSGIDPLMGFNWLIKGVIAAIIGTVGYMNGGVVGAFLLAFIEQAVIWQFSGEWKDAIAFFVLISFLILRPNGIFSKRSSHR